MGSVTRRVCSDLSCLGMHLNLAQIRVMVHKLPIFWPLTAYLEQYKHHTDSACLHSVICSWHSLLNASACLLLHVDKDLVDNIKFLLWRQLDGCSMTRPFLSVNGVACKTPWQLTALHIELPFV